jgi:hypothetical protein
VASWTAVPAGIALISIALLDVFITVLHTQVESPISNGLARWVWRTLVKLTNGLSDDTRGAILAWGVPIMIVGIMMFWAALLIVGFGLVYVPVIHDPNFFVRAQDRGLSALDDALYQSAVSLFTIGYGDIIAVNWLTRLLNIGEAGLGLLTISMAVTYLLSVYPLIPRKLALTVALNQETTGRADGVPIVSRYVVPGRFEAMGERLRTLNDELLYLAQAHAFFPVLYYVRPRNVHESFARMLVMMQGMVATLRYGLEPTQYADVSDDPRLLNLEAGFLYTLQILAASSHLAPGPADADEDALLEDYTAILVELQAVGVELPAPTSQAAAHYVTFRRATDRYVAAYARNLAYSETALRSTQNLFARDGTARQPSLAMLQQHAPVGTLDRAARRQ